MASADTTKLPSPSEIEAEKSPAAVVRGKLKLFLGAAPGVGKTYEMLLSARARLREGSDVVAGLVETHGLPDTEALLDGFEIIPPLRFEIKGRGVDELDVEAVLKRHPQVVLIDDLSHANASGSRHPRRYMDVEELLEEGIDVYSTLNIQHLESLNDIVTQITKIRIRDTVPDWLINEADDVEVIDLTPGELIQRLKEGKVFIPKQADRLLKHYYSPGTLTALRELALRKTAQRVDQQLLSHMRSSAISGPWPASERIAVCISEDKRSAGLVRYAKRLADRLHAPWTAIYVETARSQQLTEVERDRVADTLRLAERLQGQAITIPGGDTIASAVLEYARANNVSHVVIGKSGRSRWFRLLHGSVVHDLLRDSGNISVHVIAGDQLVGDTIPKKTVKTAAPSAGFDALPYLVSIIAVGAAIGVNLEVVRPLFGIETVDLVFLVAVVGIAFAYGLRPSLFAAVLSMLAYSFFFLSPEYQLHVADPKNVATLLFFFFIAGVVSNLTARTRSQALAARARAATTEALYAFSKKLAGIMSLDDLLWATVYQIASSLKVDVVILLPDQAGALSVRAGFPPEDDLDGTDLRAAEWCYSHNRPAGRGSETLQTAKRLFLPLRTAAGALGVVGFSRGHRTDALFTPDQRRLVDAFIDQAAVAIERVQLAGKMDEARVATQGERVRSELFSSLSSDLKEPLSSISSAVSSLKADRAKLGDSGREDLLTTIEDESERLSRFVTNLTNMTNIEAGGVRLNMQPVDLEEVIGLALERNGRLLSHHAVKVDIDADLPILELDKLLLEQVIVHLLENAAKYAARGSEIVVSAKARDDAIILQVIDEGPGIPLAKLSGLFDKQEKPAAGEAPDATGRRPGLGLAICQGFVAALGGTIQAANRTDRSGAIFTVTFPSRHRIAA